MGHCRHNMVGNVHAGFLRTHFVLRYFILQSLGCHCYLEVGKFLHGNNCGEKKRKLIQLNTSGRRGFIAGCSWEKKI
jgi:hypothetical protein